MSAEPIFIKFSSIHNVSKKTLEYALDVPSSTDWIVEEKVHGANFSFILDAEGSQCRISCARRSGIISEEGEYFYNYKELVAKHKDSLECVWKICKNNFQQRLEQVHVFGEIFGGFYGPDYPSSQRAKLVQREVLYHPENQFIPFDIVLLFQKEVDGKQRIYLPYDDCVGIIEASNMMFLPPMFRGSLEKALQVPKVFLTRIPAMYGLPDLPDNYSEGLVIRPSVPCWTHNGNRVIFKNKNEKFSEICRTPKQPHIEKKATFSEEEYEILKKIMTYITDNRLNNILYHGDVDESNKKRLAGMLCSDVWKEFQKENDWACVPIRRNSEGSRMSLFDGTKEAKARSKKICRELQKKCNEFVLSQQ